MGIQPAELQHEHGLEAEHHGRKDDHDGLAHREDDHWHDDLPPPPPRRPVPSRVSVGAVHELQYPSPLYFSSLLHTEIAWLRES